MKTNLSILIIIWFTFHSFSQNHLDSIYNFHPPLKIDPVLAANFGELRTNHFHAGIDYKTNRRTGYNVYAIEDGYISRIKVSPWGYGHVVYIAHYNGLTSVYAHLEEFKGPINNLALQIQSKKKHFEFDYSPAKDSLKIKKGQVIGISGNTGGSTAPHLHFEIRETETQHALNPLLYGFELTDTRKPKIRGMKVYALTKEGYRIPNQSRTLSVFGSEGHFSLASNTLTVSASYCSPDGGIGFSFDAIDQLNAADNICGIYKTFLIVDNDTIFKQDMSEIPFESNRYINSHKDYEEFHERRKHYQKTFKTIHNPLPIYTLTKNNGILSTKPNSSHKVEYICIDTKGNKSSLTFNLIVLPGEPNNLTSPYTSNSPLLLPQKSYHFQNEDFLINFPEGLLYEPTPLIIEHKNTGYLFGDSRVPLQEKYKVMMKIDTLLYPEEKYLIKRTNHLGQTIVEPSNYYKQWLTAWAKDFGQFEIAIDTVSPSIYNKNFRNNSSVKGKSLHWYAIDDLSGIVNYDVYINGDWVLTKYEPKRNTYFISPQNHLSGANHVKIKLVDACGNTITEEYTLIF